MSLGLSSPALLAGALAALIPLLLHFLRRRPPTPTLFPAMVLLLGPTQRHARRRRLRELALLVTRMTLVFAVVATLAGPYFSRPVQLPPMAGRHQAAVIVLDDTLSMGFRAGGSTLFARAQKRALVLVEVLPHASPVALLTVTGGGSQVPELGLDRSRLRRAIGGLRSTVLGGSGADAISRASRILAEAPPGLPRAIYFLTDGTRTGLSLTPGVPPAHTALEVIDVAEQALPNRAVVGLEALDGRARASSSGDGPISFRVTLQNATSAEVILPVRLLADGRQVASATLTVPAHRTRSKDLALSTGSLWKTGPFLKAALPPGDGLSQDDRRLVAVGRMTTTRVLLVDGDPRETRHDGELFYLEAALGALSVRRPLSVRVIAGADLEGTTLDNEDLVVLANLGTPSRAMVATLEAFVRRGGALLVALGDQVDPDAYQQTLGASLLPARLRAIRSGGQAGPSGPVAQVDVDQIAPSLAEALTDPSTQSALRHAQVQRYAILDRIKGEALLRLDTGAPLLVARSVGAGRVLLWTSTLDRDWTDLVHRPAFLPLVEGILTLLSGPGNAATGQVLPGHPAILKVPHKERLILRKPDGSFVPLARPGPDGRVRFLGTDQLGAYHVYAAGQHSDASEKRSGLREYPSLAFAVVPDPAESDLRRHHPMPGQPGQLGPAPGQGSEALQLRVRDDLTFYLALLCLLLLLFEGLLAARFRRWRIG